MDQEAARAAAKRLFQKISFSGGALQSYEVSSLLNDAYEYLKIPFKPTSKDVKGFAEVLDANKDGQVTLADLQTVAVQFLCGPGVLSPHSLDPSYKKGKYQTSNVSTNYTSQSIKPVGSYQQYSIQPSIQKNENMLMTVKAERQNQLISSSLYNPETLKYLRTTRQIFEAHADARYTITAEQVPAVLSKTYQALGRKGYKPNAQDVKVWMKFCDGNGDGQVEYQEYEYFVVRSLERSGVTVYK